MSQGPQTRQHPIRRERPCPYHGFQHRSALFRTQAAHWCSGKYGVYGSRGFDEERVFGASGFLVFGYIGVSAVDLPLLELVLTGYQVRAAVRKTAIPRKDEYSLDEFDPARASTVARGRTGEMLDRRHAGHTLGGSLRD